MQSSCLYSGQVFHKRLRPKEHVLRYSVFSLLLDLSELGDIASRYWPLSHNRFNLLSFYDSDFGEESVEESLESYVQRKLREAGLNAKPHKILLSCYPRVLGHAFNPLSLFYCFDQDEALYAVVHEVHNTFGERHAYVMPVEPHKPDQQSTAWIYQNATKALFVSPFAHMGMEYEFRLNLPDERQIIVIRASDDQGVLITASYTATKQMLCTSQLLIFFFRLPLLGAKVVAGIHWEALKLWLKGVPFFKHQPKGSS